MKITAPDLADILSTHKLTIKQWAALLGANERSAQRWAKQGISGAAALVVWFLDDGLLNIEDIRRCMAGEEPLVRRYPRPAQKTTSPPVPVAASPSPSLPPVAASPVPDRTVPRWDV